MSIDQILKERPWLKKDYEKSPSRIQSYDCSIDLEEGVVVGVEGWGGCEVQLDGSSLFAGDDFYEDARQKLVSDATKNPKITVAENSLLRVEVRIENDVLRVNRLSHKISGEHDGEIRDIWLTPSSRR